MKIKKSLLLLQLCCVTTISMAQTNAKLVFAFENVRAYDATHNQVDITVAAGSGYVTNNAIYDGSVNSTNPDGSWEGVNFRFTQSGTWANTDMSVVYPTNGFNGSLIPSGITGGGCYVGQPGFNITIDRVPPGPDASSTPVVVATLIYPSYRNTLTIRNTTTQACASRETFWTNSNSVNSGIRLGVQGNTVALPLVLTSFTCTAHNCDVTLNWATANEQDFDHFDVEYATDGKHFAAVGKVDGHSKAGNKCYSFSNAQHTEKGYYRLKQVDRNGDCKYSNTITIMTSCMGGKQVNIYPNPVLASGQLTVGLSGYGNDVQAQLFDNAGRMLGIYKLVNGQNTAIPADQLLPGVYNLHIRDEAGNASNHKVVVTR